MSVVVFTTPTCSFCHQLKDYLHQRGVPFIEHDVSRDPARADEMIRISGQRGVPVVLIDGQTVVGFDRPRIEQLLSCMQSQPPKLGVAIADARQYAAKRKLELPDGAYVGRVTPGSAAALAGVKPGDVIVQLAGQAVRSDRDIDRILNSVQARGTIDLVLRRKDRRIETSVQLN